MTKLLRMFSMGLTLLLCNTVAAKYADGARYAFSASATQSSVFVVDIRSQKLVDTISLTSPPNAVVASDKLQALIIAHAQEKRLTLIDLGSKELTQINYPLKIAPNKLLVSPTGYTVAIYDEATQILEVHAVKRKAVLFRLSQVNTHNDFTFNLDGSELYWTDHISGEIRSADLWSGQKSLKLTDAGSGLSAVSRSIDGRLGFVSDAQRNLVNVVDLKSFKHMAEIPVGAQPNRPWGTADGQIMLVPNSKDKSVTAISTLHLQELYTVTVKSTPVSINSGWLDSVTAIVGESGEITFIETANGKTINSKQLGRVAREGVVTADSKTLAVSVTGGISFFDMRKAELSGGINQLPHDASAAELAISNNLCH